MPKTIYIPSNASRQGIDITWTKTKATLRIGGWYDSFVGLAPADFTLRQFFDDLGITEKDCLNAWKQK